MAPARDRAVARERAGRRHAATTLAPPAPSIGTEPAHPAPSMEIAPLPPPSDKPRRRAIDSNDPYAKDRL
jgi:hypothetical protein